MNVCHPYPADGGWVPISNVMKIVVFVHILQDAVIGDEIEDVFRGKLKLLTA